jgi:hypothetical protein
MGWHVCSHTRAVKQILTHNTHTDTDMRTGGGEDTLPVPQRTSRQWWRPELEDLTCFYRARGNIVVYKSWQFFLFKPGPRVIGVALGFQTENSSERNAAQM